LNSGLYICKAGTLPLELHLQSILPWLLFEDGISQTICLGWSQTATLPISASHVARVIGMSLQHLAVKYVEGGRETLFKDKTKQNTSPYPNRRK
jgi:hypothetical protein